MNIVEVKEEWKDGRWKADELLKLFRTHHAPGAQGIRGTYQESKAESRLIDLYSVILALESDNLSKWSSEIMVLKTIAGELLGAVDNDTRIKVTDYLSTISY